MSTDTTPTITPAPRDEQPAFTPSPFQQGPAQTSNPWDNDQEFIDLLQSKGYACPGSNAGDYAFGAWLYDFCVAYRGGSIPAAAPTITALNPDTGPANTDATVAITGTGFDSGAQVQVGASLIAPSGTPTATDLSVLIPAADLANIGTVQISVRNGDGQTSGTLDFNVT